MTASPLPAGIGMSRVHVYDSTSPDGQCGGTPHMHVACTEMYVALEGRGAAEFLTPRDGFRRVELTPGEAVQFTPGTVHRLVTDPQDRLRVLVVMENGRLNEEGDVAFTFPGEVLGDPERYRAAATAGSPESARARRDLAVRGFGELAAAWHRSPEEGRERLAAFHRGVLPLLRDRAGAWPAVVAEGPARAVAELARRAAAVASGDLTHLDHATVTPLPGPGPGPDPRGMLARMCGTLWRYGGGGAGR